MSLQRGIRASGQGSYRRRAPAALSVPILEGARADLWNRIAEDPAVVEAWDLLSLAEECLMRHSEAIECLERAVALRPGGRTAKDGRRLARLHADRQFWESLPLSPGQVRALGEHLHASGASDPITGHTLDGTKRWIGEEGLEDRRGAILEALRGLGATTDFQILYNVVR